MLDADHRGTLTKDEFAIWVVEGGWVPLRRVHLHELDRSYDSEAAKQRHDSLCSRVLHPDSEFRQEGIGASVTSTGVYALPERISNDSCIAGEKAAPQKTKRLRTLTGEVFVPRAEALPVVDYV